MGLQSFVDYIGPKISAAWLNGVDRLKYTVFNDAATKAAARTALTSDAPLEVANGGTGVRTLTALSTAIGYYPTFYDVRQYGAVGDGMTDDTIAVTNAITDAMVAGGTVFFPAGTYLVTSGQTISASRVWIRGEGPNLSIIRFDPSSTATCFDFHAGGTSSIVQGGVTGLGFSSTNSVTKTAISLVDCRHCEVSNIGIAQGSWLGTNSTGLHVYGRDTLSVHNCGILCERPVVLDVNPHYDSLHTDHFHFQECEFGTTAAAGSSVEIASGVNISNLTFSQQAWELGTYGLYWNDTSSSYASHSLHLEDIRVEQADVATGYSVYLASSAQNLQSLLLENVRFDLDRKGLYLRRALDVDIQACHFGASNKELVNITGVSGTVVGLRNCFVNTGGTATLTSLLEVYSRFQQYTAAPIPNEALYIYDSGTVQNQRWNSFYGAKEWAITFDALDSTTYSLPIRLVDGMKAAIIHIAGYSATGPISAGGEAVYTPQGMAKLSGTTATASTVNFAVTPTATSLCLIDNTGVAAVYNTTGQTLRVVVRGTWAI